MARTNRFTACDDFQRTSESTRRANLAVPLSRRELIGAGLGASITLYLAPGMPVQRALEAASAAAADGPNDRILVSVFLPGGLDLLDAIVPLNQYGAYRDARGVIARPESSPKLGTTGLGIHEALTRGNRGGIKGLFEQGKIGLLPGIDYANPNLSHFDSRAFWETGLVTKELAHRLARALRRSLRFPGQPVPGRLRSARRSPRCCAPPGRPSPRSRRRAGREALGDAGHRGAQGDGGRPTPSWAPQAPSARAATPSTAPCG